jgi:multisubunit Na+/H+ antiporter MnhB subunit
MHRHSTRLLSVLLAVVGVAILARTLSAGGGPLSTGVLLGVLFVAAGLGRLHLTREER